MWSLGTAGSRNSHDVVQRSQPLSISYSPSLYSLVSPFCMVASFFPVTGSCFMPGKIDTGKSHLQPYSFWSKRKAYAFSPNSIDQTSSNALSVSLLVPPMSPILNSRSLSLDYFSSVPTLPPLVISSGVMNVSTICLQPRSFPPYFKLVYKLPTWHIYLAV